MIGTRRQVKLQRKGCQSDGCDDGRGKTENTCIDRERSERNVREVSDGCRHHEFEGDEVRGGARDVTKVYDG